MPFYMKIDGIRGSVTAKGHEGWIAIKALDFGVARSILTQPGRVSDRESTIPNVSELIITKNVDQASPKLFESSCEGVSKGTATIHFCRTADTLDNFMQYTLSNTIVSHYNINALAEQDGADQLFETAHLNFTKIEMKFVPRDSANNAQSPVISGYNLETAEKV